MKFIKKYSAILFAGSLMSFLGYQYISKSANAKTNNAQPVGNPKAKAFNIVYADTNTIQAQNLIASLDSYYNIQKKAGFNGSVLIGHEGKIIYERYFGYADKPAGKMLNAKTSSQLASTSKPFTATAVLWLHQSKYLNINDPVQKYLKNFPYENITVKMLLNHRSGLMDYTKMGTTIWKSKSPMYNDDLLAYFANNKPRLNFTPDTKFQYSNTNYAFLANIIEEVTGTTYKKFMKEFIFDPLGMKNTFVYDPSENTPVPITKSYRANFSIFEENFQDGIYGDKGIYSTPQDMYRWDQSFYNNALLNNTTLLAAYTGYSNETAGKKNYGLGWRMIEEPTYKIIFHNGWWHGNNTVFYRFVGDNFTIVVLGNKYNPKIYQQPGGINNIIKKDGSLKIEWNEATEEITE